MSAEGQAAEAATAAAAPTRVFSLMGGNSEPAPAAAEPSEAAPAAAEPAAASVDQKFATLQRRHGDLERAQRKTAAENKAMRAELEEARALRKKLDDDPLSVINPDKLTERVLRGTPQKKPEEIAQETAGEAKSEVEKLRKELADRDKAIEHDRTMHALNATIEKREDLAYSAWLGKGSDIYERITKFGAEHDGATPEDNERIALEVESEARELVTKQIRDGVKRVPALRELVLELAKELGVAAQPSEQRPDQRVSDGRHGGSSGTVPRAARSLTTSQATTVVERGASKKTRSMDDKIEAIKARLKPGA